jgi:hypothetical protein
VERSGRFKQKAATRTRNKLRPRHLSSKSCREITATEMDQSRPDAGRVPFLLKAKADADSHANLRRWTHSCFPQRVSSRQSIERGNLKSYGSTIIKRQSPKTE